MSYNCPIFPHDLQEDEVFPECFINRHYLSVIMEYSQREPEIKAYYDYIKKSGSIDRKSSNLRIVKPDTTKEDAAKRHCERIRSEYSVNSIINLAQNKQGDVIMKISKRVENLPPYLFVEINKKIAEKKARGEDVVTFAIGDPDIPTPPHIIDRLCEAAHQPENHRYPESEGLPELRKAIADWYRQRFDVSFDPETEVLPLIGSKEGIGHMAFCFADPGDTVLVPDPGYPVYSIGTLLAGGQPG